MSATEPLSPLDATFLELEEADVTAHMHIGGVLVFDPLPGGGTPTLARLRRHLERRLDALPRYRQRLSSRTTGGLHWPAWVPDERFDIAAHVTRAALPKPGGERELLAWAADFWSHRLDRGRPLWRIVLLEGLAGGRWALVTKTHHCLVDGVGLGRRGHRAARRRAEARRAAGRRRRRRPCVSSRAAPGPLRRLAGLPMAATEAVVDVVRHPRRAAEALDSARALVELLLRDELVAAPKTSLNVPLSEHRRLAVTEVPLEEIKAIKRALGRDGQRRHPLARHRRAARAARRARRDRRPPRACARWCRSTSAPRPSTSSSATASPRCSSICRSRWASRGARYRRVRAQTMKLKASHQAAGGKLLVDLAGLAPPVLHSVVAQSLFATRLFNVTVTNVPGSQTTAVRVRRAAAPGCPARAAGCRACRRGGRAVV